MWGYMMVLHVPIFRDMQLQFFLFYFLSYIHRSGELGQQCSEVLIKSSLMKSFVACLLVLKNRGTKDHISVQEANIQSSLHIAKICRKNLSNFRFNEFVLFWMHLWSCCISHSVYFRNMKLPWLIIHFLSCSYLRCLSLFWQQIPSNILRILLYLPIACLPGLSFCFIFINT